MDPIRPYYKTADIYLNEVTTATDTGYLPTLFSQLTNLRNYTYTSEFREQMIVFADSYNKTDIADIYFLKSQTRFHYDRFVGDVWAMISYIAGSLSTCYVWFMLVVKSYNRNFFANSLSNKLYSFPSQKKKKGGEVNNNNNDENRLKTEESPNKRSAYQHIIQKIETYLSYYHKHKNLILEDVGFYVAKLILVPASFQPRVETLNPEIQRKPHERSRHLQYIAKIARIGKNQNFIVH